VTGIRVVGLSPAPASPDLGDRILTALGAGIDTVALRAARALLDLAVMPTPAGAEALRVEARFYADLGGAAGPAGFFGFVAAPVAAPAVRLRPLRSRHPGRERAHLTFRSTYRPANPTFHAEHGRHHENHVAHAEVWRHRDEPPAATVVLLHGFGMGNPRVDAPALMAPALFAMGLDVVLFTLPLHGARSPGAARFSGQLFAVPNVVRINETIGQAAHDLAAVLAWVRARTDAPVGLLGVSLGGYVAALMAALAADLDFVIPVVAPVCFGDLAWRFMSASALYRGRGAALDREEFRGAFRVHSPLAHPPLVGRERLLVAAARGDRVVPAEHSEWLRAHWGEPRMLWFAGGHFAPFGRGRLLAEIRRLLADLDIV
jgi:pimeloyl-ACP methyl ester carboxylesterase